MRLLFLILLLASCRPADRAPSASSVAIEPDTGRVRVPGSTLFYESAGTGSPVILLHGGNLDRRMWDAEFGALQRTHRVIRYDARGYGRSGASDTAFSAHHDLRALMDALQLPRASLVGLSLGGRVAMDFALAHPERVRRMILLDAAGYPRANMPFAFKLARNPVTKIFTRWVAPRSLVKKSLLEVYGDDGKVTEELVQRYFELTLRAGNREAFVARANAFHEVEFERIKQITTPTLIQWGAEDLWIPVQEALRFDADIPHSELIVYEGIGHVPMEEIPERTSRDAKNFLQRESMSVSLKTE